MATAPTIAHVPDPETSRPGVSTIERPGADILVFPSKEERTGTEIRLKPNGLSARPAEVLFGALYDPRLRLRKAIPLNVDKTSGIVSVSWREVDQFGSGATMSEAIDDFSLTISELYFSLQAQNEADLSEHLLGVRNRLSEYIQPRK